MMRQILEREVKALNRMINMYFDEGAFSSLLPQKLNSDHPLLRKMSFNEFRKIVYLVFFIDDKSQAIALLVIKYNISYGTAKRIYELFFKKLQKFLKEEK